MTLTTWAQCKHWREIDGSSLPIFAVRSYEITWRSSDNFKVVLNVRGLDGTIRHSSYNWTAGPSISTLYLVPLFVHRLPTQSAPHNINKNLPNITSHFAKTQHSTQGGSIDNSKLHSNLKKR